MSKLGRNVHMCVGTQVIFSEGSRWQEPSEFCLLKVLYKSKEEKVSGTNVALGGFWEGSGTWFQP